MKVVTLLLASDLVSSTVPRCQSIMYDSNVSEFMCIASNVLWQLWHLITTKDTGTIKLLGNRTYSHPIWK